MKHSEIAKVTGIDRNILSLDSASLRDLARNADFDIIINAAQPNMSNPLNKGKFIEESLRLNLGLIEFLNVLDKPTSFLNLTSLWSFPEAQNPLSESDFWNGSLSKDSLWFSYPKRLFCVQLELLNKQGQINYSNLVLGNVYGANDSSNRLVPKLIREMKEQKDRIVLSGSGDELRDFIYVDNQVRRIIDCLFMAPDKLSLFLNIGGGNPTSVREMTTIISAETSYSGEIVFTGCQGQVLSPTKDRFMCMDMAYQTFDWGSDVSSLALQKTLRQTIEKWKPQ